MTVATLRQVLDEGTNGGYGVGASSIRESLVDRIDAADRKLEDGAPGHAGGHEVHSLDEMAARYVGSPVGA